MFLFQQRLRIDEYGTLPANFGEIRRCDPDGLRFWQADGRTEYRAVNTPKNKPPLDGLGFSP